MSRIDFLDRVFALVLVRTVSLVNPVAKDPARKDKNRPLRHYFRRKSKPEFHRLSRAFSHNTWGGFARYESKPFIGAQWFRRSPSGRQGTRSNPGNVRKHEWVTGSNPSVARPEVGRSRTRNGRISLRKRVGQNITKFQTLYRKTRLNELISVLLFIFIFFRLNTKLSSFEGCLRFYLFPRYHGTCYTFWKEKSFSDTKRFRNVFGHVSQKLTSKPRATPV